MMAGFGESKKEEIAQEIAAERADTPAHKREGADPFSALRSEFEPLHQHGPKTHIFMALVGHENTGKTGIVFDAFQKYCNEEGSE